MDQFSHDPAAYAAFDDPTAQREGSRDSLMLSAQLRLPVTGPALTVRVRNLSPGGLMAEFSDHVAIGEAVKIEVRGIGWVKGRVAWVAEGRLGIAFDVEIDPLRARKPVAMTTVPRPPAKRLRAVL